MSTVYNLERWTTALRDIYVKVRLGLSKTAATDVITGQWAAMEKHNFSNWMKYYESGEIYKYKTAQYYVNEAENYFLPNPPAGKWQAPSPIKSMNQITQEANAAADGIMESQEEIIRKKNEKESEGLRRQNEKELNDEFRRALISRLNSIEKHLATSRGVDFFGKHYSTFIKSVQGLKHSLLTHDVIGLSAQTCIDLLIKEAGLLQRSDCMVGADVMIKLAQQTPGNTGDLAMGATPVGGSVPDAGGNLTAPMPNLSTPPPGAEEPKPTLTGIDGFMFNVNGAGLMDDEELNNDDSADNEVVMDEDEVEVSAYLDQSDNELVVIGQEAPAQQEEALEPRPQPKLQEPQEGKPEEKPRDAVPDSDFDALVNSAFDKLTMEDLLAKLQDINLIFKRKEINRQLALADLMLSRLGLTPYFSNFSEVQQKNLDCLNYSATRMDDIISTLQSGIGKGKIDLTEGQGEMDPQAQLLQRHLENEEKKEKDRKEARKEVNNQKLQLEDADKPEIEVESPGEELAGAAIPAEEPVAPAPRPKAPIVPGA